ncbi:calcium-binding protein [Phyllobacterium lublinensis]|uniref:calcium-binding protein n=1 Tax=Phyllobacterium lublinensis TaxID=2875708 RepID=UPI001CCD2390|nr:hypothetical protein [Phyllobacterium sp. 2063]
MILEHRRRSWTCCLRRTCRGGRYARRRRWQRYDHGFGGNDSISDGNGDDTIDGGDGDDWFTFLGFDGSETVNGGAGIDTVDYRGAIGFIEINLLQRTAPGAASGDRFSNAEVFIGTNFNDRMTGSLNVTEILIGGAGADTLNALGFGDTLIGGLGRDILNGGIAGEIRFKFQSEDDFADGDQINDFVGGEDKIDLSEIDADPTTPEDDAFVFGESGITITDVNADSIITIASSAGSIRVTRESGTSTLVESDFIL